MDDAKELGSSSGQLKEQLGKFLNTHSDILLLSCRGAIYDTEDEVPAREPAQGQNQVRLVQGLEIKPL